MDLRKERVLRAGKYSRQQNESSRTHPLWKRADEKRVQYCCYGPLLLSAPCHPWVFQEAVADRFFQRQLYMKVFPMSPLPQADHAISASDPVVVALYSRYGGLFSTLRGAKWLLKPHALNVSSCGGEGRGPRSEGPLANVFEQPELVPGKVTKFSYLGFVCFTSTTSVGCALLIAVILRCLSNYLIGNCQISVQRQLYGQ